MAQKWRLAHITEPSNDDYDNDVSDNCDNNFGTFDDFGVKNYQKVSPQYWCQHIRDNMVEKG